MIRTGTKRNALVNKSLLLILQPVLQRKPLELEAYPDLQGANWRPILGVMYKFEVYPDHVGAG
jgi:hypothetical protein